MARPQSKPAYFLIDLATLPESLAAFIIEDAAMGGAETGARIVEQVHNGSATASMYGVYHDVVDADGKVLSNDETRWNKTVAEWEEDVIVEPVDSAALLAKAQAAADAEAEAEAAAAKAEEEAIVKPTGNKAPR